MTAGEGGGQVRPLAQDVIAAPGNDDPLSSIIGRTRGGAAFAHVIIFIVATLAAALIGGSGGGDQRSRSDGTIFDGRLFFGCGCSVKKEQFFSTCVPSVHGPSE